MSPCTGPGNPASGLVMEWSTPRRPSIFAGGICRALLAIGAGDRAAGPRMASRDQARRHRGHCAEGEHTALTGPRARDPLRPPKMTQGIRFGCPRANPPATHIGLTSGVPRGSEGADPTGATGRLRPLWSTRLSTHRASTVTPVRRATHAREPSHSIDRVSPPGLSVSAP